jgi:hypothetical protein
MSAFGGIVIAALLGAACLAVEYWTVGLFLKAKAIESWPTTTGVILSSELTSQFRGTSTTHEAHIEYEYHVSEQTYKSQQVRKRGTSTQHQSDVAPLMEKFPVGKQVPVHYNPADPSEAYLQTGVDFVNYIIIVSPLGFALLAVLYIVEQLREKKSEGAAQDAELKLN